MTFNYPENFSASAMSGECFGESVRLFSVVLGAQHAGDDRDLRIGRHEFAHQLAGERTIRPRLHANDGRSLAFRRIGGNADDVNALLFGIVN